MAEENAIENERIADQLIAGQVLIPAKVPGFTGATAHVRLEELSGEDDKGASVKAEAIITDVRHQPAGDAADRDTLVPFTIRIAPGAMVINPENQYAVRVWIDYDSDGKRGRGDLYSDERHSVFSDRARSPLVIKVVQR
jgi:hypothetical protein